MKTGHMPSNWLRSPALPQTENPVMAARISYKINSNSFLVCFSFGLFIILNGLPNSLSLSSIQGYYTGCRRRRNIQCNRCLENNQLRRIHCRSIHQIHILQHWCSQLAHMNQLCRFLRPKGKDNYNTYTLPY